MKKGVVALVVLALVGSTVWIVITPSQLAAHCDRAWLELEKRPHTIDRATFREGCNTLNLDAARCVAIGPIGQYNDQREAITSALPTLDWN